MAYKYKIIALGPTVPINKLELRIEVEASDTPERVLEKVREALYKYFSVVDLVRPWEIYTVIPGLTRVEEDILRMISQLGGFASETEILRMLGRKYSSTEILRSLEELIKKGILKKEYRMGKTRYVLIQKPNWPF